VDEWVNTTLGEVVTAGKGKIQTGPFGSQLHASDYVDAGIPCIMPTNMKNNRVDLTDIAFITEEDAKRLSRHLVQEGDIVYSRRGDVTQKALISKDEAGYFCGTGCLLVRPGTAIDSGFLTYHLSTPSNQAWIVNQAVGAHMANLNTGILANVPLRVPNHAKQKKIAAVLSTLDTKIDLNHRINAELEVLAKAIYDYWFVQFDFPDANGRPYKSKGGAMVWNDALKREIPAEWDAGSLDDLGKIVGGSTPSTADAANFGQGMIPWITPKDLSNNKGNKFIARGETGVSEAGMRSASLTLYPAGTVLMSSRAPVGYLAIALNPLTTNQGFKSFVPSKGYGTSFVYYAVERSMPTIIQYASGSTFVEISGGVLKSVHAVLPDKSVTNAFCNLIEPIVKRQQQAEVENVELAQLRDWLLPLLMNGQVRVARSERSFSCRSK